jgi:IclR family pca regulon transcriptional regulator
VPDAESPQSQTFVTAFARGLAVIEAFGPGHAAMSVADVARRTGLDRAVTRRLLLTLVELGYAKLTHKHFELTPRILRLGYSFLASAGLGGILKPRLDALSAEIGETVSVSVLDGSEVVFVARSERPGRRMAYVVTMGMRLPALTAAAGRVLLAQRGDAELDALIRTTPVEPLTPHTVTDGASLATAIRNARRDGYAVNREELEDGVVGIAVPLRGRSGVVVASLNASCSAPRATDERLYAEIIPRLAAAAADMADLIA